MVDSKQIRKLRDRIFILRKKIDKIKDQKRKELLISEFNTMLTDLIPSFSVHNFLSNNYTSKLVIDKEERKKEAKQPLYLMRYE